MNDVEQVGVVDVAVPLHDRRIHLHVKVDGAVVDRRARGLDREDLVAAVVVRRQHRELRVSRDQRAKQVIDRVARAIEGDSIGHVERERRRPRDGGPHEVGG
jgi:hypothetical protein